jgi:putative aldouronate transport system substrate-binding protein
MQNLQSLIKNKVSGGKMKRIKLISLALAVVVLVGSDLSAETMEGNIKKIRPKKTVTLQVFDQLANYSGEQTGWFAKVLLDKFNVKLNIINQPAGSGILQTRMETGSLGDLVIWGNDQEDYINAVKKDMLLDWNDEKLLDKWGPYIKAHMPYALEKNKKISGKGNVYGFGHNVSTSSKDLQYFFYTWDIRYDLYKKIGSPKINTLDDLADALAKMKEVCPKDDNGNPTYGVSLFNDWDGNMVMFVKSTATAYYGYDELDFGLYDPSTQKYHDCLEKDGPYLTCLKFYNKLYQKGLLDPDSQTQKYNGMSEDFQNGTAFFNIFNWMGSGIYNTDVHMAAGKGMFPVRPDKASPICYGQSVYGVNRIWSIGADTEYPELCMAIINWFSTPEGYLITQYGPEGEKDGNWYIKGGKTYFTKQGDTCQKDNNTPMAKPYTGTYKDGMFQINNVTWALDASNPLTTGESYNKISWASQKTPAKYGIDADWRKWAKADSPNDYLVKGKYILSPGSMFTEDPLPDTLSVKWNQIRTTIQNGSWKAIYAKTDAEFDETVAQMTKDANSYGFADCLAFTTKQVARRAAAENEAMGKK